MRNANPMLTTAFGSEYRPEDPTPMTLEGTVHKTAFLLVIVAIVAGAAIFAPIDYSGPLMAWVLPLALIALIPAVLVSLKPHLAKPLAVVYAVIEGVVLGVISRVFELQYPGIATQALLLTIGVAAGMLIAYRTGLIKVTRTFRLAVVSATFGILAAYLISILGRFVGFEVPFLHESSPLGILVSLFIVGVAAANLVLDFDFIHQGVQKGLPREYEWVGAFGLLVTLLWLYLEILRLLAKVRGR